MSVPLYRLEFELTPSADFERDLELERRKVRELQEASREREREYQKLKVRLVSGGSHVSAAHSEVIQMQHDKIKRKALLGHNFGQPDTQQQVDDMSSHRTRPFGSDVNAANSAIGNSMDLGTLVGGMEANGVCICL